MKTHRPSRRTAVTTRITIPVPAVVAVAIAAVILVATLVGLQRAGLAQATAHISLDAPVSFPADI